MSKTSRQYENIHDGLARLLRECPKSNEVVADVLEWVERLERERCVQTAPDSGPRRQRAGQHRGDAIKGYKIKRGRQGEMLIERRYDSPWTS